MHIVIGFTDNSESSSQRCGEKNKRMAERFFPLLKLEKKTSMWSEAFNWVVLSTKRFKETLIWHAVNRIYHCGARVEFCIIAPPCGYSKTLICTFF